MRLEAQKKMGYYAAHPEAVAHAAKFLRAPVGQPFAILDPCAGEGAAIAHLQDLLGCQRENVYAIELDENRAQQVRFNLNGAKILAPAAFAGCSANHNSFGFVWLNPPFDVAYDGGRVEAEFLSRAHEWLMVNGVLALVCPEKQVKEGSIQRKLTQWFYDISVVPFPAEHRPYGEVVVFALKRERPLTEWEAYNRWGAIQAKLGTRYHIPPSKGPRFFRKIEPTPMELEKALRTSPLRRLWTRTPPAKIPSPPLAIGTGHVALLLASGHLDGIVDPPGGTKHVVRGTSRKKDYIASQTTAESADGGVTTKTVISQKIELVVRTIGPDGVIRTYSNEDSDKEQVSEPSRA